MNDFEETLKFCLMADVSISHQYSFLIVELKEQISYVSCTYVIWLINSCILLYNVFRL